MYVCVCHALTEDDVRRHADAGICSAKEIRQACGMRPGCGQCVLKICALLGTADGTAEGTGAGIRTGRGTSTASTCDAVGAAEVCAA